MQKRKCRPANANAYVYGEYQNISGIALFFLQLFNRTTQTKFWSLVWQLQGNSASINVIATF